MRRLGRRGGRFHDGRSSCRRQRRRLRSLRRRGWRLGSRRLLHHSRRVSRLRLLQLLLLLLLDGIRLSGKGGVYRRQFRGEHSLGLLLGPIRTRGTRRGGRVIFLDKVLGKDALSFGTGFIRVFTVIPLVILDRGDGYDLADGKDEIILVVGSVLEDRSDGERGVGHWRGGCRGGGGDGGVEKWML